MALTVGTRLGPYEIAAPIGSGGMGEVYRAVDTRLGRVVAIKILPKHLASDPERRGRFEREARAISALNHPRICTLHDVGEAEGVHYLVLEHLEGETLAERIKRGALPVAEALRAAAEIAEALDAAHRQGVIHRDLKPGNVMLGKSGLKLLDFGLARPLNEMPGEFSQAPTSTSPVTAAGEIVGTLLYMAPEQLEGKPVDARSDIFSLGVVLYEMLTGRRAFHGGSQSGVIASILKEEPAPIPESVPVSPGVTRCLRRCLAKEPDDRWQSARDLMHELRWLAEEPAGPHAEVATAMSKPTRWAIPVVGALALLAGLAIGWSLFARRGVEAKPPVHVEVNLPAGTRLNGWASPVAAIAPGGEAVAFVADGKDGVARLYVRRLDSSTTVEVLNSATAEGPFFSPDGRWVGFAVGVSARSGRAGELLKYSLDSGLTQSICPLEDYFGAHWGSDGEVLFTNAWTKGLWKVPASGGAARNVVPAFRVNDEETIMPLGWPAVLADDRHVVLTVMSGARGRLVVVDLETGDVEDLGIQAERAFYPGDGQLYYTDSEGTLMVVPFDAARRRPSGPPVALMGGISRSRSGVPALDMSDDGALLYSRGFLRGSRIIPSELVHLDGAGSESVLPFEPQLIYRGIAVSPTGDRLAAGLIDGSIWVYDLERRTRVKLPPGKTQVPWSIAWSPDGLEIAFSATTEEGFALMRQAATGSGDPEVVRFDDTAEMYMGSWTPDASSLAYVNYLDDGCSIRLQPVRAGAEAKTLVDGLGTSLVATMSPDGKWLAYDSADTGDFEIYAQAMSGAPDRVTVSSGGGSNPRWSRDGRELFYFNSGKLMSVGVPASPGGKFGRPREIARTDIEPGFAVDPEGGFFGYRPAPGEGTRTHLELILNWREGRGGTAQKP